MSNGHEKSHGEEYESGRHDSRKDNEEDEQDVTSQHHRVVHLSKCGHVTHLHPGRL